MMTDRTPVAGQVYRHFKGNLYKVLHIGIHSESGELMVIYEAVNGSGTTWVRPLFGFVSEVDHEKYPDVKQQYRFELVEEEV